MSQWPHIFKQMVEISLLISVSCCALVPLCFGLGVWNYTCREERLKVTLDPGQCLAAGSLPLFFGKSLMYDMPFEWWKGGIWQHPFKGLLEKE